MSKRQSAASTETAKLWKGIVKVQRSIVTSCDKPQVVIYNEDRSILHQQDMPKAIKRLFKREEFKFYAHATFRDGQLAINRRARWQEW